MNNQKTILDDLLNLQIFKLDEKPYYYIGEDKDEILKQKDNDEITVKCLRCGYKYKFIAFEYKLASTVDIQKLILQCKVCDNIDDLDIRIYFDEEKI